MPQASALHSNAPVLTRSRARAALRDAADDAATAPPPTRQAPAAQVVPRLGDRDGGHRQGVRAPRFVDDALSRRRGSPPAVERFARVCARRVRLRDVAFLPGDRHVVVGTQGALTLFETDDHPAEIARAPRARCGRSTSTPTGAPSRPGVRTTTSSSGPSRRARAARPRRGRRRRAARRPRPPSSRRAHAAHGGRRARGAVQPRASGAARGEAAARQLLVVATLDATVKVFFADTLKFSLSLYGHKLPVLCVDTTDDGAPIATARPADARQLDFGDCHRSLLAHDDSATAVRPVPQTHYVFTASKDKTVKYWDADRFEQVRGRDSPPRRPPRAPTLSRARRPSSL